MNNITQSVSLVSIIETLANVPKGTYVSLRRAEMAHTPLTEDQKNLTMFLTLDHSQLFKKRKPRVKKAA